MLRHIIPDRSTFSSKCIKDIYSSVILQALILVELFLALTSLPSLVDSSKRLARIYYLDDNSVLSSRLPLDEQLRILNVTVTRAL